MLIQGRNFIVTGGASGLGAATVMAIAAKGGRVTIFDINEELGKQLAASLPEFLFWPGTTDITSEDAVLASMTKAIEKFGIISGVINCGGIAMAQKIVFRSGEPQSLDIFSEVVRVNLIGTFNVCRLVAAHIVENVKKQEIKDTDPGVIINVASVAAIEGQAGQTAYAASKGGVVGLTLPMARDLAGYCRVNTLAPGFFLTPMTKRGGKPGAKNDNFDKHKVHPARMGEPEEFAHMACSIIENPMMSGSVVRIDGAIRLARM